MRRGALDWQYDTGYPLSVTKEYLKAVFLPIFLSDIVDNISHFAFGFDKNQKKKSAMSFKVSYGIKLVLYDYKYVD